MHTNLPSSRISHESFQFRQTFFLSVWRNELNLHGDDVLHPRPGSTVPRVQGVEIREQEHQLENEQACEPRIHHQLHGVGAVEVVENGRPRLPVHSTEGVYVYASVMELRALTAGACGVEEFDDAATAKPGCKLAM